MLHRGKADSESMPLVGRKYTAWALWNSCQGVFTCGVFHSLKEARENVEKHPSEGMRVVPVTITVDPPAKWMDREMSER